MRGNGSIPNKSVLSQAGRDGSRPVAGHAVVGIQGGFAAD